MPDTPTFKGNDVFLSGGNPVLPQNAIADRLRAGNFGPYPNNTAPPGYQVAPSIDPQMLAAALRSGLLPNIGGAKPPGTAAAVPAAPAAPAAAPWHDWNSHFSGY